MPLSVEAHARVMDDATALEDLALVPGVLRLTMRLLFPEEIIPLQTIRHHPHPHEQCLPLVTPPHLVSMPKAHQQDP